MKARKSLFYLDVITILMDKNNNVCLKGQAFNTNDCKLFIYSALSYNKVSWYSDIQDEDPFSEYDIYNNGRIDAIVGYKQGLRCLDLATGDMTYSTIKIKDFINIRNKAKYVGMYDSLLPSLFNDEGDSLIYTPSGEKKLEEDTDFGFIADMKNIKAWYPEFPERKYKDFMKNKFVGIKGSSNSNLVKLSELLSSSNNKNFLPMQSFKWDHKQPWKAFDEKARQWCYVLNKIELCK